MKNESLGKKLLMLGLITVVISSCSPQSDADADVSVSGTDASVDVELPGDVRGVDVASIDVGVDGGSVNDVTQSLDVTREDVQQLLDAGSDAGRDAGAPSADVALTDVAPPYELSLEPLCEPLYRYQPNRANGVFRAGESQGLADFGVMGVPALGRGATLPTLQECVGEMAPKQCAHFDGDDFYNAFQTVVQTQPLTLVAVVAPERQSWEVVSDSVSSERHRFGIDPQGRAFVDASSNLQSEGSTEAGEWSFICAKTNGAASEIRLGDESVVGQAGTNSPIATSGQTGFVLGRTSTNQLHFNGDLLEYAVYNSACEASCEDHAKRYYAHRYPELELSLEAPNQDICTRPPESLCPETGECKIVVVGDSILQGVNPGAASPGGSACHVAAGPDSYCTTSEQTSGLCPCDGERARTGLVDAMLRSFAKPDCYSRLNQARSGSLTNTWWDVQWDPVRQSVVADVGVIGGANNDWSTPSVRTCDNVQAIALDMLAIGISKVLILGGHPQSGNDDHSAARESKRVVENECLAAFAATRAEVSFQSFDGSLVDGGGVIELGFDWGDGLHFNSVGETSAASVFSSYFSTYE